MATRRRAQLRCQPPTPRVLNLPRRHVRMNKRGRRLEALFDEERVFAKNGDVPPVVVLNAGPCRGGMRKDDDIDKEDVAGVETEMLRAECRFLRMERELALNKLKRRMERVLRSAMQILISGRNKMGAGAGADAVNGVCESLDDEIAAMRSKLLQLQTVSTSSASRTKIFNVSMDDRQFPSQQIPREIQQLAEASFLSDDDRVANSGGFTDVELPKPGRTSLASSASTEVPSIPRGLYQEEEGEEQPCAGRCRAVVRRVAEQVRFETDQWSQVQEMLEKVKDEMEQLQTSRDKWQQQALFSQDHIFSLNSTVEAWKKRALSEETKVNDLKKQVQVLQKELTMARDGTKANGNSLSLTSTRNLNPAEKQVCQQQNENQYLKSVNNRKQGALKEEKRKLQVQKRSPFLDIGNSSPLMRQITKVVFPGHI